MTDSILFSLSKEEVDYWMNKAKGDVTLAETLIELEKMEYIMNTGVNEQDWVTVPLGRKKPPPKKPPVVPPKVTKNMKLDNENDTMKHKKVNLSLSLAIQQARQKRNWGRKDLAVQLNEHESTIRDYENGTIIPSNQFIARMERVFEYPLKR